MQNDFNDSELFLFADILKHEAGLNIDDFDVFLAREDFVWSSNTPESIQIKTELTLLREEAVQAFEADDTKLLVAIGKAMRWLAEYTAYRWSVHDTAFKGHRMISQAKVNSEESQEDSDNDALNGFYDWRQTELNRLFKGGIPLPIDAQLKQYKKSTRFKPTDRQYRRLRRLLKEDKIQQLNK